jgi:PAT family beta-lactamase induction signal transducer AmpG
MFYYMHIMATEAGRNKTSILAISFALMNIGWSLPGMMSGFVQAQVGYPGVFIASSTVGMTALLLIPFLPMPEVETRVVLGGREVSDPGKPEEGREA